MAIPSYIDRLREITRISRSRLPGWHVAGEHQGHERALLYGAGWAGVIFARSAERNLASTFRPVGFLDDDPRWKGRRAGGLLVLGDTTAMASAKRWTGARTLVITTPHAPGTQIRRITDAAMGHGLTVYTVPPWIELVDGTIDASQARPVGVEDLLRREPPPEYPEALKQLLSGRTVMVTGAASRMGSELARQVLALRPHRIVLVDRAESALAAVVAGLSSYAQVARRMTLLTAHPVDITDRDTIVRLVRQTSPDVIFHAIAGQHPPVPAEDVAQAVQVNVGGVKHVVDAAIEQGVERVVHVSSERAGEATDVISVVQRLAEMVVADAAQRTGRDYVSVRIPSALGSLRDVVRSLQSRLERGVPLTIPGPEMNHDTITIPECSRLLLHAAGRPDGGDLYLVDGGDPVRTMELVDDLARLNGRDPDTVSLEYVGLHSGESPTKKLRLGDDEVAPTDVPGLYRRKRPQLVPSKFATDTERLLALAYGGDDARVRSELLDMISRPDHAPTEVQLRTRGTKPKPSHGGHYPAAGRSGPARPRLLNGRIRTKSRSIPNSVRNHVTIAARTNRGDAG